MKYNENVLKRVRQIEEKNGIKYLDSKSSLYKAFKFLFVLSFAFTVFINFFNIVGHFFKISEDLDDRFLSVYKSIFINFLVGTLVMIIGAVIYRFRFKIIGCFSVVVPCVYFIFYTKNLATDQGQEVGISFYYYWQHLIPLAILILSCLLMTCISVRAKFKTDRLYKKTLQDLYEKYKSSNQNTSEEDWEEYLKNFNI